VIELHEAHVAELVPRVRALIEEYVAWLGVDLSFQGFAEEMARLPGEYLPPRGRLLLACDAGADAACGALRPLEADIAELKRMWVRPGFRGRGLGLLLARRLIDDARVAGYRRLRLDTLVHMREANRLYERLGFVDIPAYRTNPLPGARYLELDLTDSRSARSR
jgi:GNAT superfamily N-acetyltransferase